MEQEPGAEEAARRARQVKQALVVVAAFVALIAVWFAFGGPGETSGEPAGRLAGQTNPPSAAGVVSGQPTSVAPTTTTPQAGLGTDPVSGLPWVALDELPAEVADTLEVIESGPPYPYDRDGVTFENREGLLPDEEYGYYQEFTVPTPGSSDRGARRIIWGLEDELYYTDDHYASFSRIQQ